MKNRHLQLQPTDTAYWFIVNQGELLLTDTIQVPQCQWQALQIEQPEMIYPLGQWQQLPCYLVISHDQKAQPEQWHSPRSLLQQSTPFWFEMAAKACQFALFLQTHRFCGQCGTKMHLVHWELAMSCHKCGHRCYPRVSPCVLVAVLKEDSILLARSKRHKPGFFSILAGFVESGETLEQAAIREVKEEVGVDIANLRYAGSQPWPFPHSLMMGFIADYQGGEIRCQPNEIEEAAWFSLQQLPSVPSVETLSGTMIANLVDRLQASRTNE